MLKAKKERTCRECGCTDDDCRQCIKKTGEPCYWVDDDLCSACAVPGTIANAMMSLKAFNTVFGDHFNKPVYDENKKNNRFSIFLRDIQNRTQ